MGARHNTISSAEAANELLLANFHIQVRSLIKTGILDYSAYYRSPLGPGDPIRGHFPTSLLASDHDVLVLAQAADWPEQQENCLRGVGESFSSHWTTLAGRAPNRSVFKAPAGKLTYQLSVV